MLETEQSATKPTLQRAFGRFELRQLLGKSERTMAWLAFDPRTSQELMLTLPRTQPATPAALELWLADARHAARLNHPNLAHVVEVGAHDHWPFIAVDRALGTTLGERLATMRQLPPDEMVGWMIQALEGLAFAHEAGMAHGDVQLHQLLVSEQGVVRVMALGASLTATASAEHAHDRAMPLDPNRLRAAREAAVRDVLCAGLVLHQLLAGTPPLDEPDTARVIARLPRELVRLPWTTPQPVPEGLRAIANRCTATQERQRYHNARTLLVALRGWREAAAQDKGGALVLLVDRLRTVGHLPAAPGVGARVARLAVGENQRTDEMAEQILQDMGLSFELLRTVNSAQVQGTQIAGNGPVLTIRRAISLVGLKGVRQAAASLRAWPGPLNETHAAALQRLMQQVRLAGHAAQALRPAGYDPEVVYLIAILQNLGRLMVQYHFPEEAEQIRQLMQTQPAAEPNEPDLPGMSEEAASFAVLGVEIDALAAAVAKHWGLADEVLHMIRRLATDRPVRVADTDTEMLRVSASAANEAVDVMTLMPAARIAAGLNNVAQRYGRALSITVKDITDGLQVAKGILRTGSSAPVPRAPARDDVPQGDPGTTEFSALLAARSGR
ncbi:MAG TPA: HDOD domain-containing protein [Rhizobacter sp.]|nr:HDOD domain-containing protein [Rhizobacter sp.]